ncbi:MAG TPA: A/G-specific adenine glycosylase [Candidatus Dormibacteraeota bacterium]|nr:A/G-specific adenine glycosylase [Candidatus Dormibacteraeota bacterium]
MRSRRFPTALVEAMQASALDWYGANGRDLAFRRTTDPWAILVSEVMAQQTQAARAAEAWTGFMAQFPTPGSLAGASPATVIRAWRGLGYNRRAIALRAAAIAIVDEHGGRVPDDLDALERLPGIGPYTARAVLALAFNRPVAALDVNIRRVVSRAFLARELPARDIQAAADELVPADAAAAWTHALMDIGAAFCRPISPRCGECPLADACRFAAGRDMPDVAPAPKRAATPPFPATTRWLRGRILDRLRDADAGEWVEFIDAMGVHDRRAVESSVGRLAAEGLIELVDGRARLAP